eukprot:g3478.t1
MKTAFLVMSLALYSFFGTAELSKSSRVLFSSKQRKLQSAENSFHSNPNTARDLNAFINGEKLNFNQLSPSRSTGGRKYCIPAPHMDYNYARTGAVIQTIGSVTVTQCLAACVGSDLPKCVAYNYNPFTQACTLLSTPGILERDRHQMSTLVNFAGGSVCNVKNYVEGFHRASHDYRRTTPGEITSTTDCCKLCLSESPKCAAWDYNTVHQVCFLKNTVPMLVYYYPMDVLTTSVGAYCFQRRSME